MKAARDVPFGMSFRENMLETVRIEPNRKPDGVVIFMHGLGADGHDFEPLVPDLDLPESLAIRWIFPHAPVRAVTINGGERMRAWYDITSLDEMAAENEAGIRASQKSIGDIIAEVRDGGIPARQIIVAGFSQGGALALFTALRWPERLGGVIALSCYLPLPATIPSEAHPSNASVPLFMAHGTRDPIVALDMGESSRDHLVANGYSVTWRTYPMQHGVCAQEVEDLRAWLTGTLGAA